MAKRHFPPYGGVEDNASSSSIAIGGKPSAQGAPTVLTRVGRDQVMTSVIRAARLVVTLAVRRPRAGRCHAERMKERDPRSLKPDGPFPPS
jgi:hypothetical protein